MMPFTPVLKRVGCAKVLGALIGGLAAWAFAEWTSAPGTFLWGLALSYLTLGALIGLVGFYNHVPIFNFDLPPWLRGGWCGVWFGLIMVLLGMEPLRAAIAEIAWLPDMLRSPWWLIADTAVAGAIIDVIATRFAGVVEWPGSGVSAGASG